MRNNVNLRFNQQWPWLGGYPRIIYHLFVLLKLAPYPGLYTPLRASVFPLCVVSWCMPRHVCVWCMPSITNTDAEQIRWISTVQSSVHINTVYLPSHLLDLTCIEHHGTIPDSFQVPHGLTCIQYTHSARREFPSWARPAALCIHGWIFKISRHQRADNHTWEASMAGALKDHERSRSLEVGNDGDGSEIIRDRFLSPKSTGFYTQNGS